MWALAEKASPLSAIVRRDVTRSPPEPSPDDAPPESRGRTVYALGEEDAEASGSPQEARGRRVSTVLTALLVAVGLALPGVALFLRPVAPSQSAKAVDVAPRPEEPRAPSASTDRATSPAPTVEAARPSRRDAPTAPPRTALRVEGAPRSQLPAARSPSASFEALRSRFEDVSRPPAERSQAALELLDAHATRQHFRSLIRDADRISQLELPLYEGRLPAEHAAWSKLNAYWVVDAFDSVLAEGQRFLRTYPESRLASVADMMVRNATARSEYLARERQAKLDAVGKEDAIAASEIERLERLGQSTAGARRARAFKNCERRGAARLFADALGPCRAFIEAWGAGTHAQELEEARTARLLEISSLAGLRRYSEARSRLAEFLAADPEGARASPAQDILQHIALDAEE